MTQCLTDSLTCHACRHARRGLARLLAALPSFRPLLATLSRRRGATRLSAGSWAWAHSPWAQVLPGSCPPKPSLCVAEPVSLLAPRGGVLGVRKVVLCSSRMTAQVLTPGVRRRKHAQTVQAVCVGIWRLKMLALVLSHTGSHLAPAQTDAQGRIGRAPDSSHVSGFRFGGPGWSS